MKKILLALAIIPALASCVGNIGGVTNDISETKPVTAELTENETLTVYGTNFTDTYRIGPYSSVHSFSGMLTLTKITYTYWENSNALDVETDIGLVKYRGFSTNYDIVVKYANQN